LILQLTNDALISIIVYIEEECKIRRDFSIDEANMGSEIKFGLGPLLA
jgi:hypothetical protein